MSFRIYKLGELGEVSFGILKLGELQDIEAYNSIRPLILQYYPKCGDFALKKLLEIIHKVLLDTLRAKREPARGTNAHIV